MSEYKILDEVLNSKMFLMIQFAKSPKLMMVPKDPKVERV